MQQENTQTPSPTTASEQPTQNTNIQTPAPAQVSGLVSAIIPTKNGNATISKSILSIQNQTYPDIQIIVVDDNEAGSEQSNELRKIVSHLSTASNSTDTATPARKIEVVQGQSKGPGIARHIGILYSNAEYIAFLDDDDIWSSTSKVMDQVSFLKNNSTVKITGTEKTIFVNEQGEKIKDVWQPTDPTTTYKQMLIRNPLITSSVLMYRDTYMASGGFKAMRLAEEYELWLRIGRKNHPFPIANTPGTEITYTVRKTSASNKRKTKMAWTVLFLVMKNFFYYPHNIFSIVKAKVPVLGAFLPFTK